MMTKLKVVIKSRRLLKKMAKRNECHISVSAQDLLDGQFEYLSLGDDKLVTLTAGCCYLALYAGDNDYDIGYYIHKRFIGKVIRG